jgi:D-methionine transport system permease protein
LISFTVGLPLGLVLVCTSPGGLRSLPFIILLVGVIPLTRVLVGTSIGTAADRAPVDLWRSLFRPRLGGRATRGRPRARRGGESDGRRKADHHSRGACSQALPGLIAGLTVTLMVLVGASAMAGAVGAGGLGDLAIRYGYQRFETSVMIAVIVVLIALVALIQAAETGLLRAVDHS